MPKSRPAHDKDLVELPDWRIACCFVGKGHRRQGVAAAALSGALDLIATLGGGRVEGYPEPAGAVPAGFMFNGALSTYEQAGFMRQDATLGRRVPVKGTESCAVIDSPVGPLQLRAAHDGNLINILFTLPGEPTTATRCR